MGSPYFASIGYASPLTPVIKDRHPDLPGHRATSLHQDNQPRRARKRFGWSASPAWAWTHRHEHGNINPLSIDYACRPRLRSRLTLGGQTWPRNPWSIGGRDSHSAFATHACILTPTPSTPGSLRGFTGCRTLPYPTRTKDPRCHSFGGALEPRYIVGAGPLDQ
jgi:hypothetical protein